MEGFENFLDEEKIHKTVAGDKEIPLLTFLAVGDIGHPTAGTHTTARSMDRWANLYGPPDFVVGLGDNFYPYGVSSSSDAQFKLTWRDVFLKHPSLRVPWRMLLGNHDYMWNVDAQIEYTHDKVHNADGLWSMPAKCYSFGYNVSAAGSDGLGVTDGTGRVAELNNTISTTNQDNKHRISIEFFALDTNGVQAHVTQVHRKLPDTLVGFIDQLRTRLEGSTADWKIVFGHHPMYTQGKGHGDVGRSLRLPSQSEGSVANSTGTGGAGASGRSRHRRFGLEAVVSQGGAQAYFSGHEHVFQHHQAQGVHHFVCGASGAEPRKGDGLYHGWDHDDIQLDWVGGAEQSGFVSARLYSEHMLVQFVDPAGEVLREATVLRDGERRQATT